MSRRRTVSAAVDRQVGKVFWSGRSQAVRLPKSMRFDCELVVIQRDGNALRIEPADQWPERWVEQFRRPGVTADFARPPQGRVERRARAFR